MFCSNLVLHLLSSISIALFMYSFQIDEINNFLTLQYLYRTINVFILLQIAFVPCEIVLDRIFLKIDFRNKR